MAEKTGAENETLAKAWGKIAGEDVNLGRAACIPVFDGTYGTWRVYRTAHTIYEGAENCADPAMIEQLRRDTNNLLSHYPQTLGELEKLGIRARRLLNHPITTPADVAAWAESVFSVGPVLSGLDHVAQTKAICYADFQVEIPRGKKESPAYVIPAAPRGSGIASTIDFTVPGSKAKYGPRHDLSKAAFIGQIGSKGVPTAPVEPGTDIPSQPPTEEISTPLNRRGRPRKDGLVPGSAEAKEADRLKRKAARTQKVAATPAPSPVSSPEPVVRVIRRRTVPA